jgi:hypothetical protein
MKTFFALEYNDGLMTRIVHRLLAAYALGTVAILVLG